MYSQSRLGFNRSCRLALFRLAALAWIWPIAAVATEPAILSDRDRFHPVIAEKGMVVSQHALATEAGLAVLIEGGNAVDAAVTVGFTLAVVLPRAGNLGGGGFMLIHLGDGETIAVDYRETAPRGATPDMFLDAAGEVSSEASRYSYRSAGVPGSVAGLAMALETYGTIGLDRALAPAIRLARDGFPVDRALHESLKIVKARMAASPASMAIFYGPDGEPPAIGDLLLQSDLAWSLQQIAAAGPAAFYRGAIAERIVADMRANGGLIDREDLAAYRPLIRSPLRGNYRGYEILAMPPPSSGGVHIIQMLNILEPFPLGGMGHNSASTIHLLAESMKLAYADRASHLGDADFVAVPVAGLISTGYADRLRERIDTRRATPGAEIAAGSPGDFESDETTHFSVMDARGNAVANTYTLNLSFGTKKVIAGTGILLNDEMDDFSAKPGAANAYGLVGGAANAIAPGKRMLSSMSPTIVMKDGRPFLVTGSPGGSRIITTTLQIILNVIDHGLNIAAATNAVRVHHQWLPDQLRVETGLSPDTIALLEAMGHQVKIGDAIGGTQSIVYEDGLFRGAADPRRSGSLAAGY